MSKSILTLSMLQQFINSFYSYCQVLLNQSCVYIETEIRDHGVGFFEFSKDEETRRQQLEALKKLRQQV